MNMTARRCANPRCRRTRRAGDGGYGWCTACYWRWRRAGRPVAGPPDPRPEIYRLAREEFAWLIKTGESPAEAARRVDISPRTAEKWARELRRERMAHA